ncbi:hypothetical protein GMOD_00002969 [Pyrenophora seminiperda CCB06]|uniref:Uncharacterized protein n=1 Tax=Pyrenophora seminiperda CCB06 TaxID=1302712 RepID=A0A3M7M3G0_9PLEO|nr:hypothetical protein GMOD_00002969 [Pyrenophora seminiperda CCB06]
MTSPQAPPQRLIDPQDPAEYERIELRVPALIRVRALQAYQDWVEDGGLERFAKKHNVNPDFIYHLSGTKPAVMVAYIAELEAIPGLKAMMLPPPTGLCLSDESAQDGMALAEGWYTSEDETEDEDDKEQTGIEDELEGSKEEGIKATALDQETNVSCKTQS